MALDMKAASSCSCSSEDEARTILYDAKTELKQAIAFADDLNTAKRARNGTQKAIDVLAGLDDLGELNSTATRMIETSKQQLVQQNEVLEKAQERWKNVLEPLQQRLAAAGAFLGGKADDELKSAFALNTLFLSLHNKLEECIRSTK